jgi:hypothetical protein
LSVALFLLAAIHLSKDRKILLDNISCVIFIDNLSPFSSLLLAWKILYYNTYCFLCVWNTITAFTANNAQRTIMIATGVTVRTDAKRVMFGSYIWFRVSLHTLLPLSYSFLFFLFSSSFFEFFFFVLYVVQHVYLISSGTLTCLHHNNHFILTPLKKLSITLKRKRKKLSFLFFYFKNNITYLIVTFH